nr:unnamed protein product [Digitaria exilis]
MPARTTLSLDTTFTATPRPVRRSRAAWTRPKLPCPSTRPSSYRPCSTPPGFTASPSSPAPPMLDRSIHPTSSNPDPTQTEKKTLLPYDDDDDDDWRRGGRWMGAVAAQLALAGDVSA